MIRHVPCGRCMPTASCRAVACSLTRAAPHTPGKLNWPCCCRRSRCLRRPVILRPPSPPCALATTSLGRAELVSRAMASTSPAGVPAAARPRARTAATRLQRRATSCDAAARHVRNGGTAWCDAVQRSASRLRGCRTRCAEGPSSRSPFQRALSQAPYGRTAHGTAAAPSGSTACRAARLPCARRTLAALAAHGQRAQRTLSPKP